MQAEIEIRERIVRLEAQAQYVKMAAQDNSQKISNLNGRVTNNETAIQHIIRKKGQMREKIAQHCEIIRRHEGYVTRSIAIAAAVKYGCGGLLLWMLITGRITKEQLSALGSLIGL